MVATFPVCEPRVELERTALSDARPVAVRPDDVREATAVPRSFPLLARTGATSCRWARTAGRVPIRRRLS